MSLSFLTCQGEPQNYMFTEMRAALGIPKSTDILAHIDGLPTAAARESAMDAIRTIERRAMLLQTPQPGLLELMRYLEARGVRKGICTRNFESVCSIFVPLLVSVNES